ncbi:protein translocase subunit SecD [Candidatus Pantoea edessiphila]|uniref:Protein translocase subunit SecD n=1 Tax=Candidatus Pantoea edessiphila TaxID=2044610 RepID=A0A2P5T1D9_9GAMM|nr:protein translocase subunit SecD [Candidatus Pantoea edessiphila]PPI88388.1 protein translocase subunit SecD [Candidatus Pantoea edessiphila]
MLNCYSSWKYVFLSFIFVISLLYALPNLYGEDPVIQITGKNGNFASQDISDNIKKALKQNFIKYKDISIDNKTIIVRFNNTDTQLLAHKIITKTIGKKYSTLLNLVPAIPSWLSLISARPIKLGFDLRGGVQFLIEVDIDSIIKKIQDKNINSLSYDLRKKAIPYTKIYLSKKDSLNINFKNFKDLNNAFIYLKSTYKDLSLRNNDNNSISAVINKVYLNKLRENIIQQNIEILRNRINQLGISESSIQRQGSEHIRINLPGIKNIAQAKELIGATSTLEFRLVNTSVDSNLISKNIVPLDSEIKYMTDGQSVLLYKNVILTGDHITYSTSSIDEYNNPEVDITLDSIGGNIMSAFTRDNIGKSIATLFVEYKNSHKKNSKGHEILIKNEEIINIANIRSQVNNRFRITGIKNFNKAHKLSMLLRSGTLIAPIHIVEERTIGPTMGRKNIKKGLEACLCGLISCFSFMVFFYKKFGLISIAALIINLIIIIAITSLLPGVTLTMPGIAGIILTLAVAIDANILINERIKEEICNGYSIQKAIHKGYKNALSSIIDSNIITLIKVVILYTFGTGSIRGFAIMTAIGVITSMFTAITVTKTIVNLVYSNKSIKTLSI